MTDDTLVLNAIANLTQSIEELKVQNTEALQENAKLTQNMEKLQAQNTNLTRSIEELKAQNTEALQENKELKSYIRKQLSASPLVVKQMLNDFIAQFKEALEKQKSDKMSETLKDLVEAMNNLSVKLEDTSLVQVQVNEQVMEAYEEIMDNKKQLQGNGQKEPYLPMNNGRQL